MENIILQIDQEFKNLLPQLSKEEYQKLENSLIMEGCRDALIIWNEILIDGHNRYEICTRQNINFEIKDHYFNNREEVLDWIIDNQLGKRNINDSQKAYLRGLQYEREKKKATDNLKQYQMDTPNGNNAHSVKTSERLAQIHKVDERTIREDGKYAKAIDSIGQNVGSDVKNKILNREMVVPKKDVVKIGKMNADEQKKIFKNAENENKIKIKEKLVDLEKYKEIENEKPKLPISYKHIELLINNFLADADRYLYMTEYIPKLETNEKDLIKKEIEQIKNWYENFKNILSY